MRTIPVGEIVRFGVTGTLGFLVDGGILYVLVSQGVPPLLARGLSFPVAVIVTWYLNRNWTFAEGASRPPARQLRVYFAVQIVGALTNYAVFAAMLLFVPQTPLGALAALAVGSLVGMFLTFTGSKLFAFRREPPPG